VTEAPDLAAPVVGWRIWHVGRDAEGPVLRSPVAPASWPPRAAMTAACHRGGCPAPPAWECSCGLYALAHPGPGIVEPGHAEVLGCTALWGRVVEATGGWRAERAYPLLLFGATGEDLDPADMPTSALARRLAMVGTGAVGSSDAADLRELERRYGVPVHLLPGEDLVPRRPPAGPSSAFRDRPRRARVSEPARWDVVLRRATAVRDEAGRGLAARRLGDVGARRRLDMAIAAFVAALRSGPPDDPDGPPPLAA
jgi:hypothetical protein